MTILSSGHSDIGRKRKTNQDSIYVSNDTHLYVVADGMGGHNGGDIASQMSVKLFPEFLEKNAKDLEIPEVLDQAIRFINKSIFHHGQKNEDLRGMGTTVSAIMLSEKFVNIANIGDSRVYMFHDNMLYQMTRDHSLVQEKLNLGIYDREGAKADPQKNVLIRTVGFEEKVEVDVYKYRLSKNDLFLICSDGLHGKVCDKDITKIITRNIPDINNITQDQLDNATNHLIHQANVNGGQDNISVILVTTK